ncbi:hypothetical protein MBLNU230_g5829t1 [Neophaeotheca triangularis]
MKSALTKFKRRWDSSDPERAPPPLPINPGVGSPTTKANTSANIAAAAKQLSERARENVPLSSYTRNATPETSPDRSLIRGAHHRRMQSLQPGHVRDLRNYLDGNRSPEKSPERERPASRTGGETPYSSAGGRDYFGPAERSPERSTTPTPGARDAFKDTPNLRPSARHATRSIYGENTPPSATMLALQTMQVPDQPFNDVTNSNPGTPTPQRVNNQHDFNAQILHLTTIATSLQREMANLSRRSKDNATDLISLKDATNARDEDIRNSLRRLVGNLGSGQGLLGPPLPPGGMSRSTSSYAGNHFDSFSSPPSASKSFGPRAASAHGFLEEGRMGSPSPYSVEGAASVAMLEKIIREMVTKEGQERLLSTLSELMEKSSKDNSDATKKVEELADFIKEKSQCSALVPVQSADGGPPKLELDFDNPNAVAAARGAALKEEHKKGVPLTDEVMKILQRIKDSVSTNGGMTSEVKGKVHDLRGEILGMGRELGQKLDQIGETQLTSTLDRSIEEGQNKISPEDVQQIVEESMGELKQHLNTVMQQRAEQDDNAFRQVAVANSGPSSDEIFAMVKHALAEHGDSLVKREPDTENVNIDRNGILEAVQEGLKDFEPNIELQQYGLERDEILTVLKEGLEEHVSNKAEPGPVSVDKAEVYEVMQQALKDFQPYSKADLTTGMKEELLSGVREALADFKPETAKGASMDEEATRAAMVEAVKEGLANHGPNAPRELEISRDDLFDAVKASLDGSSVPFGGLGEQVLSQLKELIDGMRVEFKEYSAANGRDTEQVLDTVKDGLETLRAEIESYVDRAQDVTGKDEIVDTVKGGLEQLRADVQGYVAHGPEGGKSEMLDYIKAEFEHLHAAVAERDGGAPHEAGNESSSPSAATTAAAILYIKEALENLKSRDGAKSSDEEDERTEEMLEAMKEEFEQLKASVLNTSNADKNEIMETIQDSMGALHSKLNGTDGGSIAGGNHDEILTAMREEFALLKEGINKSPMTDGEQDGIIAAVRQTIDDLRTQLSADQSDASAESLGAIKEELERFKESMGSSLVAPAGAESSKALDDDSLASLSKGLEEIKEAIAQRSGNGITDDQLEAIRGEFENLRTSLGNSVVGGNPGSNDELLDAVRLGMDDLRSDFAKKVDDPERSMGHHNEVLDALNEGLENLRSDVVKTLDKPLDMTVNYEILDTLKEGLSSLRSEMEKLQGAEKPESSRGGEIVLAEGAETGDAKEAPAGDDAPAAATAAAPDSLKRSDLEKVEVLLAQLQIKVEAMDATVQDLPASQQSSAPAEGIEMKEDLVAMTVVLGQIQDSVKEVAGRDTNAPEGAARKEDTDALETLLRNTKAQLDEMALPDAATAVSKEHLDAVEAVVRVTNEAVEGLAEKLENTTAAKADVAVVEVLAQEVKDALDELKEKMPAPPSEEDEGKQMTKADLDVLGVLCTDIKTKIEELNLPDPGEAPSKADIEQLQGLIDDFRESHDKMKDSYETDIGVTAKAFDDRAKEHEATVEQIGEVKEMLESVKTELLAKLAEGESGVDTLGETIKGLEEKTSNEAVTAEIKAIAETLASEFERAHGSIEAIKTDTEEKSSAALEKQAEHKGAVVTELGEKLDTLFDGLMSKYDDAQHAAEEKAKVMEEKATQQQTLLDDTKSMADELKISIDTLGTALTTFTATFPDNMEKLTEESKTVFNRVEDTYSKLEETQDGLKYEHTVTREEIVKILGAVDGVQSDMTEHNPRFMMTLKEVQALVGQHFEHSQKASEQAAEHAQAVKELQDQVRGIAEESKTQTDGVREEMKTGFSALPALMPPTTETPPAPEKYDDAPVHEKLDKLMSHAEEAKESSTQLERLDQIHEKVMATAAEVSAFVAMQAKQITADHESKEREAEEVALLLERRMVQKDAIESDITSLNAEKDSLRTAVEALRAEREAMAAEKMGLRSDVSALETALHIRRDELHAMDSKAEAIERRMLEGVMNQSRTLLLQKNNKAAPQSPKKSKARDLRLPSDASAQSAQTVTSSVPGLKANHNALMKSRPPLNRAAPNSTKGAANTAERRIMSLSQINNNVPTGASAFSSLAPRGLSATANSQPMSMKRSHSVRTQNVGRKPSWGKQRRDLSTNMSRQPPSENKENDNISEEAEGFNEEGSERRTSYAPSATGTTLTYGTGSYITNDGITPGTDDRRFSYGPSDLSYGTGSYGTGSYMTGSETDRRTSLGSTINGTLGAPSSLEQQRGGSSEPARSEDAMSTGPGSRPTSSHRGEQEEEGEGKTEPLKLEAAPGGDPVADAGVMSPVSEEKRLFAPPSDSGLGADLPTAQVGGAGSEGDYFK